MGVKVSLVPIKMFSFFCLEEGDFTNDEKATKEFEGESLLQKVFMEQQRGKDENGNYWKYHQPQKGMIGVGLEVQNKFDGGNAEWLASNANGREWAVGYHGISWQNPEQIIGKIVKEGMKHGETQKHEETKDIGPNKSLGEYCGSGIYLAPKIEICMG